MNRIGFVLVLTLATPALTTDWGKADDPKACAQATTQGQIHYYPKCQEAIDKLVDPGCISDPEMKDALAKGGFVDGQNTSTFRRDKGKKIPQDARFACEAEALKRIKDQAADADVASTVLPKAKGKNAAIEKMMREEIKTNWKDGEELLKIIFDSGTEWTINKNGLGVVVSRSIFATAVYKKGERCFVYSTNWVQPAAGKGFAGPLEEHGQGAEIKKGILCEKVK